MWTAEFADGPVSEVEMQWHFSGYLSRELWMMPNPRGRLGAQPWIVVGKDGMPPEPDHPWPGQVHYRLDEDASTQERTADWKPGDDEGHAIYRLVEES